MPSIDLYDCIWYDCIWLYMTAYYYQSTQRSFYITISIVIENTGISGYKHTTVKISRQCLGERGAQVFRIGYKTKTVNTNEFFICTVFNSGR